MDSGRSGSGISLNSSVRYQGGRDSTFPVRFGYQDVYTLEPSARVL